MIFAKTQLDVAVISNIVQAAVKGEVWAVNLYARQKLWRDEHGGFRDPPSQNAHMVGQVGPDGAPTLPTGAPLQLLVQFEKSTAGKPEIKTVDLSADDPPPTHACANPDAAADSAATKRGNQWTAPKAKPSAWSKEAYETGQTDWPNPYNLGDPT